MHVEFFADDPRKKARPALEQLLRNGTDQLVIACAYCTAAGVELLRQNASRLKNPDSFVVVSVAPPTDYLGLALLHSLIPANLFVHWGALAPVEKNGGAALMHSKVFYARAGRECWLWVGSHNLTANATQGGNCEAALVLHGTVDEQPFVDALKHLIACRTEATLYDPNIPPPGGSEPVEILVIHAEADPLPPSAPLPWRVHLCLNSADFDEQLRPPADVRLFLYPKGTLAGGWQHATPWRAYAGSLTGLNLTASNPRAVLAGTPAAWTAANFAIIEMGGVLAVAPDAPPGPAVTTQAVLYVDAISDPRESLLSKKPSVESIKLPGEEHWTPVDSDMRHFFRKNDVEGSMLLHIPIVGRRQVISVPGDEVRQADLEKLRGEIGPNRNLEFDLAGLRETKGMKRHPFIFRARYRLSDLK